MKNLKNIVHYLALSGLMMTTTLADKETEEDSESSENLFNSTDSEETEFDVLLNTVVYDLFSNKKISKQIMKAIKDLEVSFDDSDTPLEKIVKIFKKIKKLDLNYCDVTGEDLRLIANNFKNLKTLNLFGCDKLKNKDLIYLKKLKKLKLLDLNFCIKITDKGLKILETGNLQIKAQMEYDLAYISMKNLVLEMDNKARKVMELFPSFAR
jgi:hypothetical protein